MSKPLSFKVICYAAIDNLNRMRVNQVEKFKWKTYFTIIKMRKNSLIYLDNKKSVFFRKMTLIYFNILFPW